MNKKFCNLLINVVHSRCFRDAFSVKCLLGLIYIYFLNILFETNSKYDYINPITINAVTINSLLNQCQNLFHVKSIPYQLLYNLFFLIFLDQNQLINIDMFIYHNADLF